MKVTDQHAITKQQFLARAGQTDLTGDGVVDHNDQQLAETYFGKLDTDQNQFINADDAKGYDSTSFAATNALLASGKVAQSAGDMGYAQTAYLLGLTFNDRRPNSGCTEQVAKATFNLAAIRREQNDYAAEASLLNRLRWTREGKLNQDLEVHALYAGARSLQFRQMWDRNDPGLLQVEVKDGQFSVSSSALQILKEAHEAYGHILKGGPNADEYARDAQLGMMEALVNHRKFVQNLLRAAIAPFNAQHRDNDKGMPAAMRRQIGVEMPSAQQDLRRFGIDAATWESAWTLWAASLLVR